ncbi:dihydrodipicolinate synthase family protein [Roseomonas elaeocarpi]|uniref:Dihydrodipicolinate synthase family protein n=1 Tax=Roseomonas elaeocarpi TaxID=907779 RepID=A0ABV6JMU2_9PROT
MDLTGIGGIWPASLTPFAPDGSIDGGALRAHLRHLAETDGVRALVVNGHAGEATSLDREERQAVIRAAREVAGERVGVVAGVVAEDTRGACALARDAAEAGADAILLFPPLLFAGGAEARPEMALRFVSAVAAATALPIVLFQLSRASGLGYAPELLGRLCREVPGIIAVKEGSDIPAAYEASLEAIRGCGRPVTVLTTNNTWLFASLAYGADGILSGVGSVASAILADMFAASQRGDIAAARRANARLLPLTRVFYRRPALDMHNRMKTALHLMGLLPHPDPRPPLLPIEPAERGEIRAALVAAGLLGA